MDMGRERAKGDCSRSAYTQPQCYFASAESPFPRSMSPTPTMTPSASTSATFRPSFAWCSALLMNSPLTTFARAILEREEVGYVWKFTTSMVHVPLSCDANTLGNHLLVVGIGWGYPSVRSTGSRVHDQPNITIEFCIGLPAP